MYWVWALRIHDQGWMGHNPFFLAPLYPYWLAAIFATIAPSIVRVLVLQAVLGSAAVVLLADAARRLTGPAAGLLVGVLAAGYESAVFFDSLVLMESLLFALECLLLWVVARWPWESRPRGGALCVAAIIGVAAYGRATETLLLFALALLVFRLVGDTRRALSISAAAAAVVAALALPGVMRHRVLVGEWIPYTYSAGWNFYVGNGPPANGTFTITDYDDSGPLRTEDAEGGVSGDGRAALLRLHGLRLQPGASSVWFGQRALEFVARHPGRWLRLLVTKFLMLFNHGEHPQIESVALHRALIGPLGIPVLGSFAAIALLGLIGLSWPRPADPRWLFVVAYVGFTTAGILAFFVVDRYRHHLVPGLLLLGAVTIQQLIDRRLFASRAATGILVLGLALVSWPLPGKSAARDRWDLMTRLGDAWLRRGRADSAVAYYDSALSLDAELERGENPTARRARALVYENHALSLWRLDRLDEAAASIDLGIRLDPEPEVARLLAAELEVLRGNVESARRSYASLGVTDRDAARLLVERVGKESLSTENVIRSLRGAVALDPHNEMAWIGLVRALLQQGRTLEAGASLGQAEAIGIDRLVISAHRVVIEVLEGDFAAAREWLDRIPPDRWTADPRLAATISLLSPADRERVARRAP